MSNSTVNPGAVETQQLRVTAPPGVSILSPLASLYRLTHVSLLQSLLKLRLRIGFSIAGQNIQEQIDFAGFPQGLTGIAQ